MSNNQPESSTDHSVPNKVFANPSAVREICEAFEWSLGQWWEAATEIEHDNQQAKIASYIPPGPGAGTDRAQRCREKYIHHKEIVMENGYKVLAMAANWGKPSASIESLLPMVEKTTYEPLDEEHRKLVADALDQASAITVKARVAAASEQLQVVDDIASQVKEFCYCVNWFHSFAIEVAQGQSRMTRPNIDPGERSDWYENREPKYVKQRDEYAASALASGYKIIAAATAWNISVQSMKALSLLLEHRNFDAEKDVDLVSQSKIEADAILIRANMISQTKPGHIARGSASDDFPSVGDIPSLMESGSPMPRWAESRSSSIGTYASLEQTIPTVMDHYNRGLATLLVKPSLAPEALKRVYDVIKEIRKQWTESNLPNSKFPDLEDMISEAVRIKEAKSQGSIDNLAMCLEDDLRMARRECTCRIAFLVRAAVQQLRGSVFSEHADDFEADAPKMRKQGEYGVLERELAKLSQDFCEFSPTVETFATSYDVEAGNLRLMIRCGSDTILKGNFRRNARVEVDRVAEKVAWLMGEWNIGEDDIQEVLFRVDYGEPLADKGGESEEPQLLKSLDCNPSYSQGLGIALIELLRTIRDAVAADDQLTASCSLFKLTFLWKEFARGALNAYRSQVEQADFPALPISFWGVTEDTAHCTLLSVATKVVEIAGTGDYDLSELALVNERISANWVPIYEQLKSQTALDGDLDNLRNAFEIEITIRIARARTAAMKSTTLPLLGWVGDDKGKDADNNDDSRNKTDGALAVVLHGENTQPVVNGRPKPLLTPERYRVVAAIIAAIAATGKGLTLSTLEKASRVTAPHKLLSALANGDADWKKVIRMPGKQGKGLGYFIINGSIEAATPTPV